MSDDRELLLLAAKAAGIQIKRCRLNDPVWRDMLLMIRAADDNAIGWNPLTDDGDALRLAVDLHLLDKHLFLDFRAEENDICAGDYHLATRRAIVRAAAVIGGLML